jgi:hypothetical protein
MQKKNNYLQQKVKVIAQLILVTSVAVALTALIACLGVNLYVSKPPG